MEKTAKEWFQHLKEPWRSEAMKLKQNREMQTKKNG